MTSIDYYFTLVSPYAYLGHRAFVDLAARYGVGVGYKPMILAKVFENSGALPLAQRPKARQDYRLLELQRWRAKRGLPLNLQPRHFPTNPALADCSVIALSENSIDPAAFMEATFRACWAEDRDIADRAVAAEKLAAAGHDAEAVLSQAGSSDVRSRYEANTAEAVRLNVIGSPTYVLSGEIFWGQDRLELLEDALASKREPYRP